MRILIFKAWLLLKRAAVINQVDNLLEISNLCKEK